MKTKLCFLFFLLIIGFTISSDEITKNKTLNFQFENKDSYYFAHLNYEEDYEPGISHRVLDIHFLKIDHRIKVLYNATIQNESDVIYENEMEIMDVNEELKLGRYNKLKNGTTLFLKFILKNEYKDSFDKNQIFSVEMVSSTLITDQPLNTFYKYRTDFKPKEIKVFKIPNFDINKIDEIDSYENHKFCSNKRKVLFASSTISAVFREDEKINYKISSNRPFYGILIDYNLVTREKCPPLIDFIVYNKKDEYKTIDIEYQINDIKSNINYYQFNMTLKNNSLEGISQYSYVLIDSNEPGLFNITLTDKAFCSYFDDDEDKIMNLDDLLDLKHYKYIPQGIFYSPKKYFILFIDTQFYISILNISKLNIEEKGNEVDDLSFYYFKITKGNALNFTSKFPKNPYILKLFSNNKGTVNINDNAYYFERESIEMIQLKENETFSISAIDGDFTFGIKSKINDNLIDFAKPGENYTLPKNTDYRFVVYDLNYTDYISFYYQFDTNRDVFYRFDFAYIDINEIQMKDYSGYYCTSFYFHLLYGKRMNINNKKMYFIIFFGNITSNTSDIVIQSSYFKETPKEKGKYVKIKGDYYDFGLSGNLKGNYLGIPYTRLASLSLIRGFSYINVIFILYVL